MEILEKITSTIFSPRTKSLTVRIVGTNYIDAETNYITPEAQSAVTPGGTTTEERKLSDGTIRVVPVKPYTAYTVEVRKGSKTWRLQKRVLDFIKMRDHLIDQEYQVPPMRSDWEDDRRAKTKDKLFEVETPFAQQIWLTLENWLVALCQNEVISSSPQLSEFLQIQKHIPPSRSSVSQHAHDNLHAKHGRQGSSSRGDDGDKRGSSSQGQNGGNTIRRKVSSSKVSLEDFILLKVVGKGSFGKVMQVMKIDSREIYAMKVLKKHHVIKRNQVEHTKTERNVLSQINHPFIVRLRYAFQTSQKLYLVLDYCPGGELFFHLSKTGKFKERLAKFYIAEIVLAIEYLHSQNIVYRDLKPENVLLDREGHIQLTDFGLSKEGITDNRSAHSFCGTPEYLAPEILQRIGHGKAADWWSLGTLLYEMLTGMPPFYSRDRDRLFKKILSYDLRFPVYFSQQVKSILKGLMNRNPAKRLGSKTDAEEVKCHPFFDDIDWTALYERRVEPPYRPKIVPNQYLVDEEFLNLPVNSPTENRSQLRDKDGKVIEAGNRFMGFTFVENGNPMANEASTAALERGAVGIEGQ